jgi:hypothetical protein
VTGGFGLSEAGGRKRNPGAGSLQRREGPVRRGGRTGVLIDSLIDRATMSRLVVAQYALLGRFELRIRERRGGGLMSTSQQK